MMVRIARQEDLENLISFLQTKEIDESFVTPLSSRNITIRERVYKKFENGKWVIAEDDGTIAGCLALVYGTKPEISTFVVSEKHQGKGIGTRLLSEGIEVAKNQGYKNIIVDSWDGNEAMSYLMDKFGFEFKKKYRDKDKRPEGISTVIYERKIIW